MVKKQNKKHASLGDSLERKVMFIVGISYLNLNLNFEDWIEGKSISFDSTFAEYPTLLNKKGFTTGAEMCFDVYRDLLCVYMVFTV